MAVGSHHHDQAFPNGDGISRVKLRHRSSTRRGVILFVVTIVIAMASLAAYGFIVTMEGENNAAHASAGQLQVAQVAASGEEFMAAWLQTSREARWSDRQMHDDPIFAQHVRGPYQMEDATSVGQFHIVTPPIRGAESRAEGYTLDGSSVAHWPFQYGFVNESGKHHLRTLLAWDEQWPGSGRNALLQLPGMTESIADAILDWIDSDDTPREFGAESAYYRSLPRPDSPINDVPMSLEDLLRVRGVNRGLLLGGDQNAPSPEPNNIAAMSAPTLPVAAQPNTPWHVFLTVCSAERNETFDGRPRININDEDLGSLHRALLGELPTELAQFIILYRQFGPASGDPNDDKIEQSTQIALDLGKPASYQFASLAELVNAAVRVPTSAGNGPGNDGDEDKSRQFLSPLSTGSASAARLDEWLDQMTVREEESIVGRLNVFAAQPEVLYGLPLPNPAIATRILARGEQGINGELDSSATGIPGISWLLTDGLVDIDEFRHIAPYLTTGGDVARFRIVATNAKRKLVHRFEVILDATVKNTQRIYYRDLRRLGAPEWFAMF